MLNRKKIIIIGSIVVITCSVLSLRQYVDRGIQGRLMSSSDDIGDQYSPTGINGQYEPYYLGSGLAAERKVSATAPTSVIQRKVIRSINLNLQVKNARDIQTQIHTLVERLNGVVLSSNLNDANDGAKSGSTVFKIIPGDLTQVLNQIKHMGELKSEQQNGDDVTEQYVDLASRLKNYKIVRDRLEKIMNEKARQVKDILEIETELTRVGGEIESIEGRMKYLDQQSAMATVTVNFYENSARVVRGIDFAERFKKTMRSSVEIFVGVFEGAIMLIAFVLPVVLWLGFGYIIFILFRKIFSRRG